MKVLDEIDNIVKRTGGCALFEFSNGKVFWLFNHHQHVNPYKTALRVKLGSGAPPKHNSIFLPFGRFLYLTHTLEETIKRNEYSDNLNISNNKQKRSIRKSRTCGHTAVKSRNVGGHSKSHKSRTKRKG